MIDDSSFSDGKRRVAGAAWTDVQNPFNLRLERGRLSAQDIPPAPGDHVSPTSFPLEKARCFGSGWGRGMNMALGGWEVNGLMDVQLRVPVEQRLAVPWRPRCKARRCGMECSGRNLIGDPRMPWARWRDRLKPIFQRGGVFLGLRRILLGRLPRTLPNYRSPGIRNADMAIFKKRGVHRVEVCAASAGGVLT